MAKSKYEVVSLSIEELLSPGTAEFEVPDFQRVYSWEAEQINQLFDDIFVSSAEVELPYFLGSIVLSSNDDSGEESKRSEILDGQQRLTTISLLIAALRQKLEENGALKEAMFYEMRLFSYDQAMESKPKILLQSGDDRTNYGALISDPLLHRDRKYKNTRLGEGLSTIYELIERHIATAETSDRPVIESYRKMLGQLLNNVEIVRITSPSEKDAFRLFETLNDRGLALSAADLIKNKLFSRAAQSERELEEATYVWGRMVGLVSDDNVVNFLRYYWIASSGFVRKQHLYDRYRDYISRLTAGEAGELALRLFYAAEDYQQIINPRANTEHTSPGIVDALERLTVYRARSCRPALMACGSNIYPQRESEKPAIVKLCESITVRYSIVGQLNPNRLEVIYSELCTALRETDAPLGEILTSPPLSDRMLEIPSDEEFRHRLQSMEISSVTPAWRQILSLLNSEIGTGETRPAGPDQVHVDHILPQNPTPAVLLESRFTSKEEASRFIYRLGNLTLLSKRLNQQESNRPFLQKKGSFELSEFAMTKGLAAYDNWGKDEIEDRSRYLAEKAVKIFRHPSNITS